MSLTVSGISKRPRVHPATDIMETKQGFLVLLNMPGVRHEHVTVTEEPGILHVAGFSSFWDENRKNQGSVAAMEFVDSEFIARVAVPEAFRGGNVTAKLRDGVLSVLVPRGVKRSAEPVPIQVT